MSITLHLGVSDIPYTNSKGAKTTGDVAEILESKYGVMQAFVNLHGNDIAKAIEGSVVGAFESAMMGAPPRNDIYGTGTSEIEEMFRRFLSGREMDGLGIAGVPTAAALAGKSARFKSGYVKKIRLRIPELGAVTIQPSRPSFIDTGLYEGSMKAWVD